MSYPYNLLPEKRACSSVPWKQLTLKCSKILSALSLIPICFLLFEARFSIPEYSYEVIVIDQRYWTYLPWYFGRTKVMVEKKYENEIVPNSALEVVLFEDDPAKDYLMIFDDVTRIILRFKKTEISKNVSAPEDTQQFEEYWKRSEFRESLKLDMKRSNTKPVLPNSFIEYYVILRDYLIQQGIFPLIFGGTLLGWYRENGIIPHTTDLDLAADASKISEINFLVRFARANRSTLKLHLSHILGLPDDNFELKITTSKGPKIDIFGLYHTENGTWVGGTAGNRKYIYEYIKLEQICAADLLDRLVWIPCDVDRWLTVEYGPEWRKDHRSDKYVWYKSQFNVRENGFFTPFQLEEIKNKWTLHAVRNYKKSENYGNAKFNSLQLL